MVTHWHGFHTFQGRSTAAKAAKVIRIPFSELRTNMIDKPKWSRSLEVGHHVREVRGVNRADFGTVSLPIRYIALLKTSIRRLE
jgi:hypothetical protein